MIPPAPHRVCREIRLAKAKKADPLKGKTQQAHKRNTDSLGNSKNWEKAMRHLEESA